MRLSVRNLSAWFVARLLIMSGSVRAASRKALNGEHILCIYFHKPTRKEFESCVRWFTKNKFLFLSLSDLDHIIHGEQPFPKGGVVLTVDDGWQSNATNVIEVANQYGVPVAIFVSTSPVEEGSFWWSYWLDNTPEGIKRKPAVAALKKVSNQERMRQVAEIKTRKPMKREALTVEQIKSAARSGYITFGGHTHTHPILINCNEHEVRTEFRVSKEKLEDWTGKEVQYNAYPNGDYSSREMRILQELNCRLAFCSEPSYLTPERLREQYCLPRFGFLEGASFAENICRMVGIWKSSVKRLKSSRFGNEPVEAGYPAPAQNNVTVVPEIQLEQ